MTSRTLQTSSLLVLAALARAGAALADPPTLATVRQELSGYEQAPTADTIRAWGTDGALRMMALANDAAEAPFLRARAVSGLRYFAPNEAVHTFLTLVASRPGDLLVRRAAFDALVLGFEDLGAVAPMLDAQEIDVRDGAAWALAAARSDAARALLQARLRVEGDPTVRLTLTTALGTAPPARITAPVSAPVTVRPSVRRR